MLCMIIGRGVEWGWGRGRERLLRLKNCKPTSHVSSLLTISPTYTEICLYSWDMTTFYIGKVTW